MIEALPENLRQILARSSGRATWAVEMEIAEFHLFFNLFRKLCLLKVQRLR